MTAVFNSDVTLTWEISPGEGPLETPVWVDVSDKLRSFETNRGRSRVLDEMQAGHGVIVAKNDSGDFDPGNSSGTYFGDLGPMTPTRIRATENAVTYDLFYGMILALPQQTIHNVYGEVVMPIVDGFKTLAMDEQEHTEVEELSGTRIGNLLDVVGWPGGRRDIDAGAHTVAGITDEFDSALGAIQRTVLVENGLFWIAGNGDATFRDGNTRIEDDSIQATFSDDGADLAWDGNDGITPIYDEDQVWNRATVTRVDGVEQTGSDATSITLHGPRDLHASETLHVADGEAAALRDWWIAEFKDADREGVERLDVHPERGTSYWASVLGLEIWDKVNVERTPPGSALIDLDYYVEGISHSVTKAGGRREWVTTFQLSPDLPFSDWWVLGTSLLGTDTRLGY